MSWMLRAAPLILNERGNILNSTEIDEQQGRPPRQKPPHSTQKSKPLREKGEPLTCSPYKQSGGSSGFSPPGPAFSLQREYLSVVTGGGGMLGGSWSGLPWLSYTSRGRKPKNTVSHLFAPKELGGALNQDLRITTAFPPSTALHESLIAWQLLDFLKIVSLVHCCLLICGILVRVADNVGYLSV